MSTHEPAGNPKVLGISFAAFSLGFGIWGMFSALGPFLIRWYGYSPGQALMLAAMPPLFATIVSVPLGALTDRYGGRKVFTGVLVALLVPLLAAPFVDSYAVFLVLGMLLGLGGASFVVGNAHVSSWYPQSRQGTALGIFALGNIGITIGMIGVPFLINHVLGGPGGDAAMQPKIVVAGIEGWRLVFLVFALPTLVMALIYWTMTSDPPARNKKQLSIAEIVAVYRSGSRVWLVVFLYWVSFGTLTFFSAFTPTYLADRWHVDGSEASMVYTALIVMFVAVMRPVGGWLSDRHDPIRLLGGFFGVMACFVAVMVMEISFPVQITAMLALALLSGAAAAAVVKLIPTYFPGVVGTVSGLAKAAGAACGFVMCSLMAFGQHMFGDYRIGFLVWAAMNVCAFLVASRPALWRVRKPAVREDPFHDQAPLLVPRAAKS